MFFLLILLVFTSLITGKDAATHWMVTENGLIQPKLESPFEMSQPHDLVAFLNQDTRWHNIISMYHDLYKRNEEIRGLWSELERETDVTALLDADKNCIKAGSLTMIDWYGAVAEDIRRKIPENEFKFTKLKNVAGTDIPDCKKISSLTFSMFAYEHLDAMSNRENLTGVPELSVIEKVAPAMDLDHYGNWAARALRQNSTSWLHYHMASLYWRLRGHAAKAVECSRRAVYYAPRQYKDIALLSLGVTFHRSRKPEDAIVVLGAAVDHNTRHSLNHFTLANAYAVIGDYNSSIRHFDKCLQLDPDLDLATKHKHAVLCHSVLLGKMKKIQVTLDELRNQLVDYSQITSHWIKTQAAFLRTKWHEEEYDCRNIETNSEKMSELTGLNVKELKKEGDKNSLIQYFLDGPMYNDQWLKEHGVHAVESAYSLQRLVKHIEKHSDSVSDLVKQTDHLVFFDWSDMRNEIGPTPEFTEFSNGKTKDKGSKEQAKSDSRQPSDSSNPLSEFEGGIWFYPPTFKVSRIKEEFDKDPDWPTSNFCKEAASKFPKNLEAVHPVFLPFENKGIRLKKLLTDKIGAPVEREVELPWHPPVCPHERDSKKTFKSQMNIEVMDLNHLKVTLLVYATGAAVPGRQLQDAEIGQRIYAALQKELAPKWILYTLSSLYWRVRKNNNNAIHCLQAAVKIVPSQYKDLVLTSLGSVYLEMGYFEEALTAAEEAFRVSLYEPATNFLIAQLNMIKKHRYTQMFHLKQVVRVEPTFMAGDVRHILNGWACKLDQIESQDIVDLGDGDICTQVEPGVSMVCGSGGTDCHVTNIQCYQNKDSTAGSLVRMMELNEPEAGTTKPSDLMDDTIFNDFIDNMPESRNDVEGHRRNYERMRNVINSALHGCGDRRCHSILPEDLALEEDDCFYQHLQLGYWLHIISFKQLIADSNTKLLEDVIAMQPSSNKVPECPLYVEPSDDFFYERLSRVDVEGWEPVLGLMHQFAETFNYYDYVTLGAKIAKYVETRPRSWWGLVSAGWWCGAGGRGHCAARCLLAAAAAAPGQEEPVLALTALLHMQTKLEDAKDISYLMFYQKPKSKLEAFLVAVSHTYMREYEQAVWMYRYALTFDDKFLPAKACLHATMCLILFGDGSKKKPKTG